MLNNTRIQEQNQVPFDFPTFVREGFDVKVIADGYIEDQNGFVGISKLDDPFRFRLIYKDVVEGNGDFPKDNQSVVFDYTGYNENGARIDSTYRRGKPAQVQLGAGTLIPGYLFIDLIDSDPRSGFELALKSMKPGGKRRIIIPPALGPPVGPSTFFSAKQCEVS